MKEKAVKTKKCSKCKTIKRLFEFFKNRTREDGRSNECKECYSQRRRDYRDANYGKVKLMDRKRNKNKNRQKMTAARVKRYEIKYPQRSKSTNMLKYAVRMNRIIKPDACDICNLPGNILGHHEDYDRPLDVIWMCRLCHSKYHQGKGKRADNVRKKVELIWNFIINN